VILNKPNKLRVALLSGNRAVLAALLLCTCLSANALTTDFSQRNQFREAREQLRLGQLDAFRRSMQKLEGYILQPYLQYYYLNARIRQASQREVLRFTEDNAHLPATRLLFRRWLRTLGEKRQWRSFLKHYTQTSNAELQCYHLRAMYGTGKKSAALELTTNLWLQPTSQPKACDPLFDVWRKTSHFNQDVAWQRLHAAIVANQRTLANYLTRYFSGANKTAAVAFYNVHVGPSRISRYKEFSTDTSRYRQIIAHGLTRLAARNPDKAAAAWQKYQQSHKFSDVQRLRISEEIAVRQASKGTFPDDNFRQQNVSHNSTEQLALAAIKQQQWQEGLFWINRLPTDLLNKSQWQYWQARAGAKVASTEVDQQFLQLAQQRHYYGFLAARNLGLPGKMNAAPSQFTRIDGNLIQQHAGLARAIELFAVEDDLNARREWYAALDQLSVEQQAAAAELAKQIGLIPLAIRSANIAEATDHLHLRFPLAHEPAFRPGSLASGLPAALLFAIARQESAMEAKARSTADARGLMQLLPSTAKLVARRAKQPSPSAQDLYDPTTNIRLGSYHMAWLMERYNQQTPLAIAAYNAGEHRVDRWIKDIENMPVDVWIEGIPFRETRNYVKNVLAFRHVYSNRLNAPSPILSPVEQWVKQP